MNSMILNERGFSGPVKRSGEVRCDTAKVGRLDSTVPMQRKWREGERDGNEERERRGWGQDEDESDTP